MRQEDGRRAQGDPGEGDQRFGRIFEAIKADPQNEAYTRAGIGPPYTASATSRIVIIGQAPGRVAQDTRIPWNDKSGDLPPRRGFAQKWHPRLLELMPDVRLTVLIGSYATRRYLGLKSSAKLTDVVRDYRLYLPKRFPLAHPSPRNQIWMKRNPWFEEDVVPELRRRVAEALAG